MFFIYVSKITFLYKVNYGPVINDWITDKLREKTGLDVAEDGDQGKCSKLHDGFLRI